MPEGRLAKLARQFATEVSTLLNGTVTDGVRLSTIEHGKQVVLGRGIGKNQLVPDPIPIALAGGRARVFLYLVHSYVLDQPGKFLMMRSSNMSLYTSEDMGDDDLIIAIDYVRDPKNEFPDSHLHVAGQRDDLDRLYRGDSRKSRKLRDLHLPTGGRRFRPTLEDLVEFMVTEEMAIPKEGWRDAIGVQRSRWLEIQVKAAVRRYPDHAADCLSELGWQVSPPAED